MNNTQTIKLPINNQVQDFVLVPFKLFQKFQQDQVKLKHSLAQKQELVETLKLIREGENEYTNGKTTTQPLSSLMS